MLKLIGIALIGAAAAYFLDPDKGARRRNMARDRIMAIMGQTGKQIKDQARYAATTAAGKAQMITQAQPDKGTPDDATLADKVESIVFRDVGIDKGKININAEEGVVVLRGEVERPDQINALEEQVRGIPGVQNVQNLLHLPNTPPPMA